jgi:hypothetical protein
VGDGEGSLVLVLVLVLVLGMAMVHAIGLTSLEPRGGKKEKGEEGETRIHP